MMPVQLVSSRSSALQIKDAEVTARPAEMEIMDHPLFYMSLADDRARPLPDKDGFVCSISIINLLPVVIDWRLRQDNRFTYQCISGSRA